MQQITTHQIDEVNKQIEIRHIKAHGIYNVKVPFCEDNEEKRDVNVTIPFWSSEGGGVTNEALIAIVIHRLEEFQAGENACEENDSAILDLYDVMTTFRVRAARIEEEKHEAS